MMIQSLLYHNNELFEHKCPFFFCLVKNVTRCAGCLYCLDLDGVKERTQKILLIGITGSAVWYNNAEYPETRDLVWIEFSTDADDKCCNVPSSARI
jgi:hypothetical protein